MSYKKLIENNVRKAFKSVKDLKIKARVIIEGENRFDFNTAEATSLETENIYIDCIIRHTSKESLEKNSKKISILVTKKDVPDLQLLNKLEINKEIYVVSNIKDNGYTATCDCEMES